MSLIRLIILAITLCGPAFATPAQDALHDKIMAGDIVGVEDTLTKAVAQDATSGVEPELQRDLFTVFWVTDPKIDAFTAKWVAQSPSSAYAMTARGWYLHAMGKANRGEDWMRVTYAGGVETMLALDSQALALFTAASTTEPGLLAASDGLLALTQTVASEDTIPLELERIMTLHPNRGSLMRAMYKLAPQWGGDARQVQLVCNRYAPMVTTLEDYTPEVCGVDAVYYGHFVPGQMRDEASITLQSLTNPVLDYARVLDVLDGKGTAANRLAILENTQSERQLSPNEASAMDQADIEVNHRDPAGYYAPNYQKALSKGLDELRLRADRDPLYTTAVLDYVHQQEQNLRENGIKYDMNDARARVHRLLTAIPHSWRAWMKLADLNLGVDPGSMEKVGTYLRNSIYYSNYGSEALQHAVGDLMLQTDMYSKRKATSGKLNQTAADVAELDHLGRCPILGLTRLTLSDCAQQGVSSDQCLVNGYMFLLKPLLEDVAARGVCQTEANAPLESLLPGPVPADF